MKINLVSRDEKKRRVTFEVTGAELSYLNTLRRFFTSEVPILAIETLEFRRNDSGLYDEIIAHRLGLTPFTNDFKSYNLMSECKCKGKGCARCQLTITLKAEGPCTVYASDIKTKDPKVKPVFPKMPITKLLEGQKLEFEGTMIVGLGKDHTKWSPCLTYYRDIADVKIEKQPANKEQIAEHCPTNVFDIKNDMLIAARPRDCILCGACVDLSNGKIKVTPSGTCLMTIESWGHLEPEEIVTEGLNTYNKQLEDFAEQVSKIK